MVHVMETSAARAVTAAENRHVQKIVLHGLSKMTSVFPRVLVTYELATHHTNTAVTYNLVRCKPCPKHILLSCAHAHTHTHAQDRHTQQLQHCYTQQCRARHSHRRRLLLRRRWVLRGNAADPRPVLSWQRVLSVVGWGGPSRPGSPYA